MTSLDAKHDCCVPSAAVFVFERVTISLVTHRDITTLCRARTGPRVQPVQLGRRVT